MLNPLKFNQKGLPACLSADMAGQAGYIEIILFLLFIILFGLYSFKSASNANIPSGPCSTALVNNPSEAYPIEIKKTTATYQLIRRGTLIQTAKPTPRKARNGYSEIAIFDSEKHAQRIGIKEINGTDYLVYIPGKYMEFDIYKNGQIVNTYGKAGFDAAGYKLVFAIYLQNGQPIIVDSFNHHGDPGRFLKVDIYQEQAEIALGKTIPPEIFTCAGGATPKLAQGGINIPTNQIFSTDKKELQLEYFNFTSGNFGWVGHCKPAIYLYPEKETAVNVKVNTRGFLTYTDPKYPVDGWDGVAFPDGKILVDQRQYPYLYYESKVPDQLIDKPKEGFIVGFGELKNLYQLILPTLGLNEIQTLDFIEYWEKSLPYSPYYFVGIMSQENIDEIEPLEITPKPDYINRVRIYFEALEKKPTLENLPVLNPTPYPLHPNFKVIEWGGMVKMDKLHPFTCSQ